MNDIVASSPGWAMRDMTSRAALCQTGSAHQRRDWHRSAETVLPLQQACFRGFDRAFPAPFDLDPFFEPKYQFHQENRTPDRPRPVPAKMSVSQNRWRTLS